LSRKVVPPRDIIVISRTRFCIEHAFQDYASFSLCM
jgi:hypothetical protein